MSQLLRRHIDFPVVPGGALLKSCRGTPDELQGHGYRSHSRLCTWEHPFVTSLALDFPILLPSSFHSMRNTGLAVSLPRPWGLRCRWFMMNSSKSSGIVSQKKSSPPSRMIIAAWHIPDHQSWHPNVAVSPPFQVMRALARSSGPGCCTALIHRLHP